MNLRISASITGIMCAAAIVGAFTANADPTANAEVQYCQDMASLGNLGDCVALASYGRGVCVQFDKGYDWYTILKRLDAATGDEQLSADILVVAVADMCPWNESKKP